MAAAELRGAVKVSARLDWELMPLEGVGPLCFGMRITEVAAVLPGMTELRRFKAAPFSETLGVEFGMGRAKPAVYAYFIGGRCSASRSTQSTASNAQDLWISPGWDAEGVPSRMIL
ncbi:hypothetical protein ABT255_60315 [Streptomyces mirabilis]|uniref:hypothetical protein n=1 Tax=Streptomyces mirabilis TaxID=68239 RepID=UPI00332A3AF3